ncbi:MAG: hypothetical protein ACYC1D_12125 [Acidimicrobiales bacterium]
MPRTREQLQQAAVGAERWLDSLDPAAIASPDAVAEAREHGHTWTQIAAMLGTSRQTAQERYGEPAERPCLLDRPVVAIAEAQVCAWPVRPAW